MYVVEVYTRFTGNVLEICNGFKSIESAMDWGEKTASEYGDEAKYRVFPR